MQTLLHRLVMDDVPYPTRLPFAFAYIDFEILALAVADTGRAVRAPASSLLLCLLMPRTAPVYQLAHPDACSFDY